ncbi:MAG: flagellar biosynthetic protein FliR [Ktedonobacterales bacterium]|nr:flagellar biosynthetic protein FliR [Ktedonobacterales bacterium]
MVAQHAAPLVVFLLVFARISSALVAAPIFSEKALAVTVKIGLSGLLAAILTPGQIALTTGITGDIPTFVVLLGQQVLLGLAFALIFTVIYRAGEAAGEIIGQQMGVTLAEQPRPDGNGAMNSLSALYRIIAGLIFLGLDGQHWVLLSLGGSLNAMPVTRVALSPALIGLLMPLGGSAVLFALGLALPLLATTLLADVITGLLGRAMPSLNLFVLGLPMKVALAMAALVISAPFTVEFLTQVMRQLSHMGLWR